MDLANESRDHALIWLEIASRSEAFRDQANFLAEQWLTLASLAGGELRPVINFEQRPLR
jgi:hypothetical protein